jgi:HAD superfamily hydrolase (TIGR01509 family)
MPKVTAILNDLDGLLVNSEQLHLQANQEYFKQFGIMFTEELHGQGAGRKFDKWIPTIFPDLPVSGEEALAGRDKIFFKLAEQKLELLPGALEYLQMVSHNFKNALVTSSRPDYFDIVFRKTGIHTCFDLIVDATMVQQGKPDPECYLIAAKMLGVEPQQCLVFEDAPAGVLAGKAAGMRVANIPSPYVKGNPDLARADFHLASIKDATLAWIKSIVS